MKNYITLKDIRTIYNVSQATVDTILKKHKVDTFKVKRGLVVNFKDFHKAYTTSYNPSLFSYSEKKVSIEIEKYLIFADIEKSFLNIFSKPYKKINKKGIIAQNALFTN